MVDLQVEQVRVQIKYKYFYANLFTMTKENITERVRGGGVSTAPSISKVGTGGSGGRNNPTTKLNPGKVTPQSQIRKIDPAPFNRSAASVTSTPSGDNLKSGSFGISKAGRDQAAQNRAEFKAKIDAVKSSENKPVVSSTTKQGKPRTKAQMMAAKRIASGKTIADVKKANIDAMRARAAEKFADFKARREAKRLERMKEEYTPYDMVLEYLLSTEQAATIEEANYVMMQLDEENIQEIVGQVAKLIMKTPIVKLAPALVGTGIATKMIASRMGKKSGENQIKNSTPIPKKSDPIKDLIPNIKKRNKALEDAIEKS